MVRIVRHMGSAAEGNDADDIEEHKTRKPALMLSDAPPFLFPLQLAQHHDHKQRQHLDALAIYQPKSIRYSGRKAGIDRNRQVQYFNIGSRRERGVAGHK